MSEIHNKISELQMAIGKEINNAFEEGKIVGRAEMLNEVVFKLAVSEDTILSDEQYYTLMELKEHKND